MILHFSFSPAARILAASALILLAATTLKASRANSFVDETPATIEIVGPSVLLNARDAGAVQILDLRSHGRRVPNAIPAAKWDSSTKPGAPIFLLGEEPVARQWAQTRNVRAFIVLPQMIEFHALPNVPQIAPRAAKRFVDEARGPLFDISEASEFAKSRLPNSQRFDYADFRAGRWNLLPKNRPFVIACRVGHRSQLVVQVLRRQGYDARNLDGGLWNWECDGLKVER